MAIMEGRHVLVEGRDICPRHRGSLTNVGRPCLCGMWSCSCGVSLGMRMKDTALLTVDPTWEAHVRAEGGTLPELSELRKQLGDLRAEQYRRLQAFNEADERLCARIARAQARSTDSDFDSRRYTIEQTAANAAMVAGLAGRDADEAHELAYAKHKALADKHGLTEVAETEGLTISAWIALKDLEA